MCSSDLANAIQASAPETAVRIVTRLEHGGASLEVTDHGVGIPPDDLARIWTPFFTTRPSGTGLGLAIVRRIVEAHDGRIDVTTAPGAGTTMHVRIETREDESR